MNDFLNSKSMITPGVAGALVTMITATLSSQFGMPAKWIAISLSVLLSLVVFFADQAAKVGPKLVAFVLNALIIFSVSVGTNSSIVAAKTPKPATPPYEEMPAPTPTP